MGSEMCIRDRLGAETTVIRSGPRTADALRDISPDALVLGPGPGTPEDSGHVELVGEFGTQIPILGVCLGHQAIAVAFGGTVVRAEHIMHGKRSNVFHDSLGMYKGIPAPVSVTRYQDRPDDRMALRQITDEVMYEIRELSGQDYVDTYATKKSETLPAETAVVGLSPSDALPEAVVVPG